MWGSHFFPALSALGLSFFREGAWAAIKGRRQRAASRRILAAAVVLGGLSTQSWGFVKRCMWGAESCCEPSTAKRDLLHTSQWDEWCGCESCRRSRAVVSSEVVEIGPAFDSRSELVPGFVSGDPGLPCT